MTVSNILQLYYPKLEIIQAMLPKDLGAFWEVQVLPEHTHYEICQSNQDGINQDFS